MVPLLTAAFLPPTPLTPAHGTSLGVVTSDDATLSADRHSGQDPGRNPTQSAVSRPGWRARDHGGGIGRVSPGRERLAGLGEQTLHVCQVVEGEQPGARQVLIAGQVVEIRAGVARAGLAGAAL